MANAVIQVPPDAGGKKIDTSQVSIFGDVVQRQRVSLFDPSSADSGVTVENGALNVAVQSGLMFGRAEDQGARPSPRLIDSSVQLPPDSTGKKLDMSAITTVGGDLVQRQRIVLADSTDPSGLVTVTGGALNVNIVRLGGNFVSVLTPNDGDVLTFDAGTGRWVARAPTGTTPPPTPAPTVTGVSPLTGSTAGGTSVTITGANFGLGATVTFAGIAATNVVVLSTTSLTCTTPARVAGAVTVAVTVSGQSGNLPTAFTFVAPPTVTAVSPNTGTTAGGTSVTITGTGFVAGATVTFGGTAATNVSVTNATTITCTTPAKAAGAVAVQVTSGGLSGSMTNAFTYQAPATPVYGGVGAPGATASATLSGTQVTLSNGAVLDQLQTAAETVGQILGPLTPNGQCIYLLLTGAARTFTDANTNFTFPFDPPITVSLSGRTLYLYASQEKEMYMSWNIKIAS